MGDRLISYGKLAVLCYFMLVSSADASPMTEVLCSILEIVQGSLAQGLATLGVIMIGATACLGKASWGMAITVAVGISVVFNAATIAGNIGIEVPC
jgi:type IV secretory pathway VirB2 component (pilin)